MKYLRIFFSLDPFLKKTVLSAFYYSGKYRFLLLHRPFSSLASRLGETGYREYVYSEEELRRAVMIGQAVSMVCRHTPWESLCLVQAFTARTILSRHKIHCNIYLGVRKDENGALKAHAWVRCGNLFVTGFSGHESFTVSGIFHG